MLWTCLDLLLQTITHIIYNENYLPIETMKLVARSS